MKKAIIKKCNSSFRDPSGFIYFYKGQILRQINTYYKNNFNLLINSGLYKKLINSKLLIPHKEKSISLAQDKKAYKIISPQKIPFISYPYEWCFSQLKEAALLTLKIQEIALSYKLSLKDATAYNIQFVNNKPILIDTLSFEKYTPASPWVAYKQFCQHFLAPLALMSHTDIRLNQLLKIYIDGIPLDLASKLLPTKTKLQFSLLSHIHLHAKCQTYFADKNNKTKQKKLSNINLIALIDNLKKTILSLKLQKKKTEWSNYYKETNYSSNSFNTKKKLVKKHISTTKPKTVWDLGGNTGIFSRLASKQNIPTISFDIDPLAIEFNYLTNFKKNHKNILPLILDLTNPSPGLGWANLERSSIINRGPADLVLALALVHHLAISNNLPFSKISRFIAKICNKLIIEFVPKTDSQVQRLLTTRQDIFPNYTQKNFETEFKKLFKIIQSNNISGSKRILYLMRNKNTKRLQT